MLQTLARVLGRSALVERGFGRKKFRDRHSSDAINAPVNPTNHASQRTEEFV